jgi:hypothetical protein
MNLHEETIDENASLMTRRELFAGAGMTAGALAALGGIIGTTASPAAQAAAKNRQYFSSSVSFELDGAFAGRLLSAEGGEPVIVPGAPSADLKTRSPSTLRYEPLFLRFGDMSAAVFDWVGKGTINAAAGRNASVVTFDALGKELYRLKMQNARLTEIMFDGLDGGVAEAARFSARIVPGLSSHDLSAKAVYKGETFKTSPLLRSNFRLYIQGLETATLKIRTIDPIGLQARPDGLLVPTALRFTLPLAFAAPLFTWMNDTLAGAAKAVPGELQLLNRDFSKVAASIAFEQLSILRISCPIDATAKTSGC